MDVGTSRGRPFSQRQVALVSGCPNSQGWTVCDGAGKSPEHDRVLNRDARDRRPQHVEEERRD
jgi:hypothetical protein